MNSKLLQQKIIVGLSGGVDSSVAALILKQQGFEVQAIFMKNWEGDDKDDYCAAEKDFSDAQAVCNQLGIPIQGVNFSDQYWDRVFAYFLQEYSAGRTPNPDILCNKEIKFRAFLDYALSQGVEHIATGHYARILKVDDRYALAKAIDTDKDQSYFLHMLNQEQLAHSYFPLGEIKKTEVRKIAEKNNLITHNKKDSTGICFIGERDFKTFLKTYLPAKPGCIKTLDGINLGQHEGLMYYTRGQRHGLQLGGHSQGSGEPWYVADKDLDNNVLYVAQGRSHPMLYSSWLITDSLHWISGMQPTLPMHCTAKTRYRQKDVHCVVIKEDDHFKISFPEAQWSVTPGQSVVLYENEICLGGGIITQAEHVSYGEAA